MSNSKATTGVSVPSDAIGRGVLASVDVDAVTRLIAELPAASLIAELEALVDVLVSSGVVAAPRGTGLLGKLLGRDLIRAAHPDPVADRVRLHQLAAAEQAEALEAAVGRLEAARRPLVPQADALADQIEQMRPGTSVDTAAGESWHDASDRAARRLDYLKATADSWRGVDAHAAMAVQYGLSVLDRHAQVRDVLIPLWRQHHAANALSTHVLGDPARSLQALAQKLARQIRELANTAPMHSNERQTPSTETAP